MAADNQKMNNPSLSTDVRICAFESRKGSELKGLLERQGLTGVTIAPSMREVPLGENPEALAFAGRLFAGMIDVVLLLTGVGTRALAEVIESQHDRGAFLEALQKCTIIVRGPKPAAVLREWKVRIDHQVPEPNTWRDLVALLDAKVPVAGKRVAVQEYGQPNPELYAALDERGAETIRVPVYRWALPEDTGPLREAVHTTVAGGFDVLMFTSAQQLRNVLTIAEGEGIRDAWLAAARKCVIASIGPTASETIRDEGLPVDIEPEHPKMGHLVQAVARDALAVLAKKREA
ncbi:MAG TPA: uroporphyrinogen-III synthase [Planctomycetaceae bacterium]|jgi:uroporphyrinogen-III synthase